MSERTSNDPVLMLLNSTEDRWIRRRAIVVFAMLGVLAAGLFMMRSVIADWQARRAALANPPTLPATVPNGGLYIDPADLHWGSIWHDRYAPQRNITFHNPTPLDIHIVDFKIVCGMDIYPDQLVVPAGGSASVLFAFDGGPLDIQSDELVDARSKPLVPVIAEYPGTHPGWRVDVEIKRAMSIEREQKGMYWVRPLRAIESVSATIGDSSEGISVEGPDETGDYIVRCERELAEREHLYIHAHMAGEVATEYVPRWRENHVLLPRN